MLSAIGRATARQARDAGRLSIRLTAQLTPRTAPVIPSGIRVAAVFARGFAEAGAPKKTAKKQPAAKKPANKAAAEESATKKAAKPKAAAAEKGAKPKRKTLTEEERANIKRRALVKTALLKEEPARLTVTAWTTFVTKSMKGQMERNPKPTFGEAVKAISAEFKALSDTEKEKLEAESRKNSLANQVMMRNWIDSYTPQRIHEANLARRQLKRKYAVGLTMLSDSRLPKKAMNGYMVFVQSRMRAPEFDGLDGKSRVAKISPEWKQLSPEERESFEKIGEIDAARMEKERAELEAQK